MYVYLVYAMGVRHISHGKPDLPDIIHHDPDVILSRVGDVFKPDAAIQVWRMCRDVTHSGQTATLVFDGPRHTLKLSDLRTL